MKADYVLQFLITSADSPHLCIVDSVCDFLVSLGLTMIEVQITVCAIC